MGSICPNPFPRSGALVAGILLVSLGAFAQNVSIGVVAGGSLTDAFQDRTSPVSLPLPSQIIGLRSFSPSKDWIVGAMVEVRLNPHWSLELDGLFRQLHMTTAAVLSDGSLNSVSPSPVVIWEFPVLAKYRFQEWKVKPFVEAGPSFRTTGNLNGTNPSHRGIAAGLGIEMHWRSLKIAPVVRYTRWISDSGRYNAVSGLNQVELVVGFSHTAESNWGPLGRRASLGVILGTNLRGDYPTITRQVLAPLPRPPLQLQPATVITSSAKSFVAGPTVELKLPKRLSVEVDALYRPLSTAVETIFADGTRYGSGGSHITWEFPALAKYRFSVRGLEPFLGLGPSFRLPQSLTAYASPYGIVAGAGVEIPMWSLKMAPAIRYTHWAAPERPPGLGSFSPVRNQSEFLVAFSF